jgi:L-aspartate oxidase
LVDVLVVGAGLAGMSAAIEAAEADASVVLASAEPGSSPLAQGGIAAALGAGDAPGLHAGDTLAAGAGLCDPEALEVLTGEARSAVEWLAGHGVAFDRERDGRLALGLEAAHCQPRIVHAGGDSSGAAIVAALRARLDQHVTRVGGAWLRSLLRGGDGVAGAVLCRRGAEVEVRARQTVLATGGYAGLFERTTTTSACDGGGLLAALSAGAALADLEFVQFHPTAYAGGGRTFLLTEALRGAGAHLTDSAGRRFLLDADPRGELAPRAVVTRAIVETGLPRVFLDARHLGSETLSREFPGFLARCHGVGIDPLRDAVPIAPAAHYTMGGIVTDGWGHTGVPGLFAAGECARSGVHGANRLASNSLLEAVVFGRRAARAALAGGRRCAAPAAVPPRATGSGRLGLAEVRRILSDSAGPLRWAGGLEAGLERLTAERGASERAEAARQVACLVLRAALLRKESRGAHVRTDHPTEDPAWASREVRFEGTAITLAPR